MANLEHVAKLKEGVTAWNQWREENPEVKVDLEDADLNGADLRWVNLNGADLHRVHLSEADLHFAQLNGAHLNGADLSMAQLNGANLNGAQLNRADLNGARLNEAQLNGAHLNGADLSMANLIRARLSGADLTEAFLLETVFGNTNLANAQGLDTCSHAGPSIIDYSTLAQSGPLPLSFLRGCGLPDNFITYLPSLLNQAIQFHSCFISYSTKDQEFADRLHADLQNKGVRCWFAPHDIQGGKKIYEQIESAIQAYDRLLLLLSEASMNSEWVKTEIAKARKREIREQRRMLFPLRLVDFETLRQWECFDADTGKDSAREIREYYVPDFSEWKDHDSYHKEFEHLMRDLKPEQRSDSSAT